jgi:hypothetical protein
MKALELLRRFGRFIYFKRVGMVVFDIETRTPGLRGYRTKMLVPRFLFSAVHHLLGHENKNRLEKPIPPPGPTDTFYVVRNFPK